MGSFLRLQAQQVHTSNPDLRLIRESHLVKASHAVDPGSAKEHQSRVLYHRAFALLAGRSAGFDAPLSHVVNETFPLGPWLCTGNLLANRRGTTRKKTCGSQRHCGRSLDARHGFPFALSPRLAGATPEAR